LLDYQKSLVAALRFPHFLGTDLAFSILLQELKPYRVLLIYSVCEVLS